MLRVREEPDVPLARSKRHESCPNRICVAPYSQIIPGNATSNWI
jgi:hypothetical protein